MLVYHGSPNKFDQFDYSRIRTNGTSEGVGFYFTNNKEVAAGYGSNGYLYTVKLNGKKALSDNNKTITRDELKRYIIELDERTDGYFLTNYGDTNYSGYDSVLNKALDNLYNYNDTDTEIMGDIYNTEGESELAIHLFYDVLGYDHIVSVPEWEDQRLYIALTNDIISIKEVVKMD